MNKHSDPTQITLPEWPIAQLRELTPNSDTWLVGGTVRDLILNRPLHDWDFVTRKDGIRLAKMAANAFYGAFYVLDESRETGRAIVQPPGRAGKITLDFASLRGDSLTDDLKKRDFTMNAIAMSFAGHLIDPLRGKEDIASRVVRMTNSASFKQDPVRLLRALRQAHLLDFTIETKTREALYTQSHLISSVSPERILNELCAMLSYSVTAPVIDELKKTQLLDMLIPELLQVNGSIDVKRQEYASWRKTIRVIEAIDHIMGFIYRDEQDAVPGHKTESNAIPHALEIGLEPFSGHLQHYFDGDVNAGITYCTILRWAALLLSIPAEKIQLRLTALRMPKKSINTICRLIQTIPLIAYPDTDITRKGIYRFYKKSEQAGPAAVILALACHLAVASGNTEPDYTNHLTYNAGVLLKTYFYNQTELLSPVPLLRGDDLIALGITPGPDVGSMLDTLVEAQVTGEVSSNKSAVEFVQNHMPKN